MSKRVPKHIRAKIERMSRLMDTIVDLNIEVEKWVEKNTDIDDCFDFAYDHRDERGYGIIRVDAFVKAIEEQL